jgi:hypothetical protein
MSASLTDVVNSNNETQEIRVASVSYDESTVPRQNSE